MRIQATPNFREIQNAYTARKSGILLEGGSRSGKTWAILQWILIYAATNPNVIITAGRDAATTLKKTVWRDLKKVAAALGSPCETSDHYLTAKFRNGSLISGVGLNDDIALTHGLTQEIFWINEAMFVGKDTFDQLEQRTSRFWICDYNPSSTDSWIYNIATRQDVGFFKSTVVDNPFAPAASVRKIRSYEPTPENVANGTADQFKWNVYGLGERAVDESAIFPVVHDYRDEPEGYDLLVYGGDFGFTDDPTVLVQVKIDGRNIYCREMFRSIGLVNQEIAKLAAPYADSIQVWDSSEQKSIQELRLAGINAVPATKGPDSVMFGIQKLRGMKIHIHVDSDILRSEFKGYRYAKGRNGEWIRDSSGSQVPIDINNHGIDAVRYAVTKFKT